MTDRNFMGIRIQGDYVSGRYYTEQRPMNALADSFRAAFDKGVKAIAWHQYTPYFNDGEPCEFRVGDFSYTSNDYVANVWLNEEFGDEDDNYDSNGERINEHVPTDLYSYEEPWSVKYPHPDGFVKGQIDLPDGSAFEQVLNETFGDHTTVVVTPEKVMQFSYDHE